MSKEAWTRAELGMEFGVGFRADEIMVGSGGQWAPSGVLLPMPGAEETEAEVRARAIETVRVREELGRW